MILSHAKIEEIAAAVIKDFNLFFFGEKASEARSMPQGTPIDQFASEYLRLKISFEKLSVDGSLCGLTAYEDTEYAIEENGVSRTISLKRNQVLLDSSFIAPGDVRKLCGIKRQGLTSLDRAVVVALIDKILIHSNDVVEIIYRWQDEFAWQLDILRSSKLQEVV